MDMNLMVFFVGGMCVGVITGLCIGAAAMTWYLDHLYKKVRKQ